jgi:hypothetical protein
VPVKPLRETIPLEEMQELQKKEQGTVPGSGQPTLLLPLMMNPAGGVAAPGNPVPLGAPGGPPAAPASSGTGAGAGTGTGQ